MDGHICHNICTRLRDPSARLKQAIVVMTRLLSYDHEAHGGESRRRSAGGTCLAD